MSDRVLNKLITKLQGETKSYAVDAIKSPVSKTEFEYGVHHGVVKGFSLVEQWIQEMLEEQEDDDSE